MRATDVMNLLKELNIPVTNTNFPPNMKINPPFIVFLRSDLPRFLADNKVYDHYYKWNIELYTKDKSEYFEDKLIEIFEKHEIVWEFIADNRIQEDLYEVVFQI